MTPAPNLTRRVAMALLLGAGAAPARASGNDAIASIERRRGGRLGVFVLETGTGRTLAHRADERFLLASTFKGILAAMVLSRVDAGRDDLDQPVRFSASDLVETSPVTVANAAAGSMTVGALCAAILRRSDNTAANLLLRRVGGPASLTDYARALGDAVTRFDRYEPVGGWSGARDTTTPRAIAGLARTTVLGNVLRPTSRAFLQAGMRTNVPGRTRLRASFPPTWTTADRTGTEDGICNDYAIVRRPHLSPLVVAAYHDAPDLDLPAQEAVLRDVGGAVVAWAGT